MNFGQEWWSTPIDITTMSKTWLKNNLHLTKYVTTPGYNCLFHNLNAIRGGGVGVYIKDHIKYKRRSDIENKEPQIEHL